MIQRRVTEEIFVHPDFGALIGRIEATIHAQLSEKVKMSRPLRVEEQRQSRINKKSLSVINESRRTLIDEVTFEINQTAYLQLELILRIPDRQRSLIRSSKSPHAS